jgi:hypothetical protein
MAEPDLDRKRNELMKIDGACHCGYIRVEGDRRNSLKGLSRRRMPYPPAAPACLITGRRPHFFPRAITGSSKPRRHFSFGSEAYFSFSAMVRYRSRLGSVFAAHFLNLGSTPPWRSFSSPRRPGRRTQRIKARLLFIAQRTVEFRERGLHGLHRAKRGVEPLLHRLDPTRGGQRLVG